MAQSIFMPPSILPHMVPSSPDPTPLRLLAFSVAEAALQSDPNSPSFGQAMSTMPSISQVGDDDSRGEWVGPWSQPVDAQRKGSGRKGNPLWSVVERAKERRNREQPSPAGRHCNLPPSPPVSPSSYNFILPAHSPLAASIAAKFEQPSARSATPSLSISTGRRVPLYTRSAEPSPTRPTFSHLDQSLPPPEFKPRLSAVEFFEQAEPLGDAIEQLKGENGRDRKQSSESLQHRATVPCPPRPSRHNTRLPSLKQIQAKMTRTPGHRRGSSVGSIPFPRPKVWDRSTSDDSIEVLQTPTEENPHDPTIVPAGISDRRPPTPPSPLSKDGRLSSFLRERTSGRLAGVPTPVRATLGNKPTFKVTPPSRETRSIPLASKEINLASPTRQSFAHRSFTSPTKGRFGLTVHTPPARTASPSVPSPTSPTGSIRSFRSTSTASPTQSVPIITCTPAPQTVLRDGVEHDSDEEGDEVVVFDGEAEETKEREERERRAETMKQRLSLRRLSD